jgi:hypothetical protein
VTVSLGGVLFFDRWVAAIDEGHGFSRVPMSLRLTQGDENHGEAVFDCAENTRVLDGFSHWGTFLKRSRAKSIFSAVNLKTRTEPEGNWTGAPRSPHLPRLAVGRTWAENDGRSPTTAFAESTGKSNRNP